VAHWAFLRVYESDDTPEPIPEVADMYLNRPVIFYGVLPLVLTEQQRDHTFWRCSPNILYGASAMPEFETAKAQGWACHHCLALPCPCEVAFLSKHPDALRVCCLGHPGFIECVGALEVQEVFPHPVPVSHLLPHELEQRPMPAGCRIPRARPNSPTGYLGLDYVLIPAPDNGLVIEHLRSGRMQELSRHRGVVALDRMIEHLIAPYLPSEITKHLRAATTFAETFFPFYHWGLELPVRRVRHRLGQFGVETAFYADRGFPGYVKSVLWSCVSHLAYSYVLGKACDLAGRLINYIAPVAYVGAASALCRLALIRSVRLTVTDRGQVTNAKPWSLFYWLPISYRPKQGLVDQLTAALTLPTPFQLASVKRAAANASNVLVNSHLRSPSTFYAGAIRNLSTALWGDSYPSWLQRILPLSAMPDIDVKSLLTPLVNSLATINNGVRIEFDEELFQGHISRTAGSLSFLNNLFLGGIGALACVKWISRAMLCWPVVSNTWHFLRYRRTVRWVNPKFAEITQHHVGDLQKGGHLDIPSISEIATRLALRAEVDEATARHTISNHLRRHDAFDTYIARPAVDAFLQRQLRVAAHTSPQPVPLPPNTCCWVCRNRVATDKHVCRTCRRLRRHRSRYVELNSRTYRFYAETTVFRPLFSRVVPHPYPDYKTYHYHIDDTTGLLSRHVSKKPRDAPHLSWIDGHERVFEGSIWHEFFDPGVSFWSHLLTTERVVTQRGVSCGPIMQGYEPSCFVRGDSTAAAAFLIRNLAERPHWHDSADRAALGFWNLAYYFLDVLEYATADSAFSAIARGLIELEPDTVAHWLSQLDDPKKRAEAEEALREIDNGAWPEIRQISVTVEPVDGSSGPSRRRIGSLVFKGFTKAEKTAMTEWHPPTSTWVPKSPVKPRFICVPGPMALAALGRYTHRQTKWLTEIFPASSSLFYAGCSEPAELRRWLNENLARFPQPLCVIDDISAMDANHSPDSFRFHNRVRAIQYPTLPADLDALFRAIEHVSVKIGRYAGRVSHINPSGVPDTSYKNSLMAIMIRWMAFAHATFEIFQYDFNQYNKMVNFRLHDRLDLNSAKCLMRRSLAYFSMAASGDDGLIYTTPHVAGQNVADPAWLSRYVAVWNASGFNIVVSTSTNFRLATFLAHRPVYSSAGIYEWAPEPARRLRGLFWMIDKHHHPVAWARGVASQVVTMARHCPVLADVCGWYLRATSGPTMTNPKEFNRYNPMWSNKAIGVMNERGLEEFLLDYKIPRPEYDAFLAWLNSLPHPFLSLNCFVFERILDMES
jgi:hypothetical protein